MSLKKKMAGQFNVLTATAAELHKKLGAGDLTSVQLVDAYLDQIRKHDGYLHAVIQINPQARNLARQLDVEREQGRIRGFLHGIPILVKV